VHDLVQTGGIGGDRGEEVPQVGVGEVGQHLVDAAEQALRGVRRRTSA
jgi:hypothetical protein